MTKLTLEELTAAMEAHKQAWDSRTEQRNTILARYGVTLEEGSFGLTLKGGISDHWGRMVRLEFSSYEGWQAGTTGTICSAAVLETMHKEMMEVVLCVRELVAMGDTTGSYFQMPKA